MKIAVVGSRSLNVSCLEDFIPSDVGEIVPEEQPEWILAQGSTHEETVKN